MDYLRRLLLRSLAVPREHGSPVFDPFAQVAGWEFDGTAPPPQESAADSVEATVPPPAPQRPEAAAWPMQPVQAPQIEAASTGAAEAIDPPTISKVPPPSLVTMAPPAHSDNAVAAAPQRVLLTQADAFMRSLGMKSVVAPEEAAARQGPAAPGVPAPHRPQTSGPAPHTGETRGPVLVRPAIPPAVEHPRVQASPRRKPDPATAGTAHAAAAAHQSAPPIAAPPERIVQTTVVIAAGARGLDDLAHSSGISRFGIGQG